jgi:hypothetical protein
VTNNGNLDLQPLTGRWHHEASERQIKRGLTKADDVLEIYILQQTFFRCIDELIIVRTGIAGGDTRDIHGGWIYTNDIVLRADWEEIRRLEPLGRPVGWVKPSGLQVASEPLSPQYRLWHSQKEG